MFGTIACRHRPVSSAVWNACSVLACRPSPASKLSLSLATHISVLPTTSRRAPPSAALFARSHHTGSNPPPPHAHPSSNSAAQSSGQSPPPRCFSDFPTMAGPDKPSVERYLQASHDRIFEANKRWAEEKRAQDPEFFDKLTAGQTPEYLYIGCSDSRIPANQIMGLEAGEVFAHRNIANLVCNTDLNVMSVINYAVRHLRVKHIIVCGHYNCGGVKAAMTSADLGILNPWLRNIRDVYRLHETELDAIPDENERYNRLVELNVLEQARNIIKTAAVQKSYEEDGFPIVHAWIFDFKDGLLKDLNLDFVDVLHKIQKIYNLCGPKSS